MIYTPLHLQGAFLISPEPRVDERGSFARVYCAREFAANGLENAFVQANISSNKLIGTVRGTHLQKAEHAEVKLVRRTSGAVFDVIVDLREGSPTRLQWFGTELSEENGVMMYVPKGFAHGYQTVTPEATVHYMVSAYYAPESEAGHRFDDPAFAIEWPHRVTSISDKDAKWPLLPR